MQNSEHKYKSNIITTQGQPVGNTNSSDRRGQEYSHDDELVSSFSDDTKLSHPLVGSPPKVQGLT